MNELILKKLEAGSVACSGSMTGAKRQVLRQTVEGAARALSTSESGAIAFVSTGGTDVQLTFDDNATNGAGGLGSQVTCTAVLAGNTESGGGAKLVWAVEGSLIAQAENATGAAIFT